FHATPPTELYTLSLHDALPIYGHGCFAHDLQNTCSVFRIDLLAIKVQGKPFGFEVGLYRFAALHFRRCLGQCMHDRLLVEIAHPVDVQVDGEAGCFIRNEVAVLARLAAKIDHFMHGDRAIEALGVDISHATAQDAFLDQFEG